MTSREGLPHVRRPSGIVSSSCLRWECYERYVFNAGRDCRIVQAALGHKGVGLHENLRWTLLHDAPW